MISGWRPALEASRHPEIIASAHRYAPPGAAEESSPVRGVLSRAKPRAGWLRTERDGWRSPDPAAGIVRVRRNLSRAPTASLRERSAPLDRTRQPLGSAAIGI